MSKRTLCRTRKQWRYVGRSVLENLLPYIDNAVCSVDFRAPGCSSSNDLLDYLESFDLRGTFCHHTLTASFPKSLEMAAHRATLQPFLWHQGMDKY
ncbi:MAG: hypothetical protein KJO28_15230 [Desulfofustis sp.]|nr:hypothetical protein [Desulfofustis sp.]